MIYIHIPFCKQKCSYCNFHFSTNYALKEEILLAIKEEITIRKNELQNKELPSLYFGGGTPSVLSVDEIQSMIDHVLKYFDFSNDIEITLEANPDDLNENFVKRLAKTEINRLSIGTQSFLEEDLKLMNRAHNASQAEDSIKRAQDNGFENLSIDLIYGSPTSDFENWKLNLQKAVTLEIPHISSYALTVEPKTALSHWVSKKEISPPNEAVQNRAFYYMSDFLRENGFNHYEISNFCKPNFHSKHNSNYWKYKEYLGIGPSAHSYNGSNIRSWNIANNTQYIKDLRAGILPIETEYLTEYDQYNEMLMIGLRTTWGVNLAYLKEKFSKDLIQTFETMILPKISDGILVIQDNHLKIPEEHWFLADGIAADLFLIKGSV